MKLEWASRCVPLNGWNALANDNLWLIVWIDAVYKRLTSIHISWLITTVLFPLFPHLFDQIYASDMNMDRIVYRHFSISLSSYFFFFFFSLCSLLWLIKCMKYISVTSMLNRKKDMHQHQQQLKPMSMLKIKCPYTLRDKISVFCYLYFGVQCAYV